MFVFAAMAEFAFVLLVNQNQKWKNTKELDGPSRRTFNRVAINTGNDAINSVCNVDPEIIQNVNIAQPNDREIRQISFWSKKYAIFYGLSFPTKIDCAGFVFFYLGYFIFNGVYIVWVVKTFYKDD